MDYSQEFINSFKEDYNKLPLRELLKKYDLSSKKYTRLKRHLNLGEKKKVVKYTEFTKLCIGKEPPKYYSYTGGKYHINRTRNGKTITYTSCYTEELAKKTVEMLKQCNWDRTKVPLIKKQLGYDDEYFHIKYKHINFDEFKRDYDRLNYEELLEKYNLSPYKYTKVKNYLKLGRKKVVTKNIKMMVEKENEQDKSKN